MSDKKSKGLLISFPGYPYITSSFIPDNGLASLAGVLKHEHHWIEVIDFGVPGYIRDVVPSYIREKLNNLWDEFSNNKKISLSGYLRLSLISLILEYFRRKNLVKIVEYISLKIQANKIDFIGLKLWNGDGLTGSIFIARKIKAKFPKIKIFGGGPQVSFFEKNLFKLFSGFDALCVGEGEAIIGSLADFSKGKKKLEDIPNIIYKHKNKYIKNKIMFINNLNQLPYPDYSPETYPAFKNNNKIKLIVLDESRGCPNKCVFCHHPYTSGNERRCKSSSRIIKEIIRFKKMYGVDYFRFAGSNTPYHLILEISKELLIKKINIKFSFFGHVNSGNTDFDLIHQAGCIAIFLGLESGSQEILDSLNKKITINQIIDTVGKIRNSGIKVVGSFIYPTPHDNEKTLIETLKLINLLKLDSVPIQMPGVLPHTEWYQNPTKYRIEFSETKYLKKLMPYKYKIMFPPRFWGPLPYLINGKKYKKFSSETTRFIAAVKNLGFLTQAGDEIFLFSDILKISANELTNKIKRDHFVADYKSIASMVEMINQNKEIR